ALAPPRVGLMGVAQDLHRHVAVQRRLPGPENYPHPPGTQNLHQLQAGNTWPVRRPDRGGVETAPEARLPVCADLGPRSVFRRFLSPNGEAIALPAGPVERAQLSEQDLAREPVDLTHVAGKAGRRAPRSRFLPGPLEAITDRIDVSRLVRGELLI